MVLRFCKTFSERKECYVMWPNNAFESKHIDGFV